YPAICIVFCIRVTSPSSFLLEVCDFPLLAPSLEQIDADVLGRKSIVSNDSCSVDLCREALKLRAQRLVRLEVLLVDASLALVNELRRHGDVVELGHGGDNGVHSEDRLVAQTTPLLAAFAAGRRFVGSLRGCCRGRLGCCCSCCRRGLGSGCSSCSRGRRRSGFCSNYRHWIRALFIIRRCGRSFRMRGFCSCRHGIR
ncbi:hypothetical protein PENTCL1PPCAC_30784, partial [Pristionchus entomophagus]